MAISFARFEFMKRREGKTVCGKAAYNARCCLYFEGNKFISSRLYDWSYRTPPAYHEILLPCHAKALFLSPESLWNAVERSERRSNSQTAFVMVLALPDDPVVSIEDRIFLARSFIKCHFIDRGFAAQLDIHAPEESRDQFVEVGRNWHAHFIITTRRFNEDGSGFESRKPRGLFLLVRKGRVVSGTRWGELWSEHQNAFFVSKGLSIRVDWDGIVSQQHLGPVRMQRPLGRRAHENKERIALNQFESQNVGRILLKVASSLRVFSEVDVERFFVKNVFEEQRDRVREAFWNQEGILPLKAFGSEVASPTLFSTKEVIVEEERVSRALYRLFSRSALRMRYHPLSFNMATWWRDCGEGSSPPHLFVRELVQMRSLSEACESLGYRFWLLIPDRFLSKVFRGSGFSRVESLSRFLYSYHGKQRKIERGREVIAIDALDKIPSYFLLQILKISEEERIRIVFSSLSYTRYVQNRLPICPLYRCLPKVENFTFS